MIYFYYKDYLFLLQRLFIYRFIFITKAIIKVKINTSMLLLWVQAIFSQI